MNDIFNIVDGTDSYAHTEYPACLLKLRTLKTGMSGVK